MTKLVDITPDAYRCSQVACPAVFRSDDGKNYTIIGKFPDFETIPGICAKADPETETIIEISAEILEGALFAPLRSLAEQMYTEKLTRDEFVSLVCLALDRPQEPRTAAEGEGVSS